MKFDDYFESEDLLDALWDMHFDEMTPIQELAIPKVIEGKDLLACAQTGTGKTAAYLLPVIDLICTGNYPEDRVNCVIMAPTRELAQQIDRQMQGFSYFLPITSLPIYGGTDGHTYEQQRKGLKLGADVVIATPGRLISHLQMGSVDLSEVSFFILDEADRMLDMGFYDDIMSIVKNLPADRQTLLFSATMPPKIRQLAKSILTNPAEIKLSVSKPADKIDQVVYYCDEAHKDSLLETILNNEGLTRVIVFVSSKLKVKQLARSLRPAYMKVGEMHSDLDQNRREDVMLDFKAGKINILIATDIVSRGIDIDDIQLVINYDVPREAEDYVHRVGRTARADRDGKAITLVGGKDRMKFRKIEKLLGKRVRKGELPADIPAPGTDSSGSRRNHNSRNQNNKRRKNPRNKNGDHLPG
ncbi:MAG: DEAD/DEAH box helicase [Muribaculaceae bacterium]|nr:DEAD/DEAH box helicase [Muribaculaceae bacterium]